MFKKIVTVEYFYIERYILGNKIKLSLNLNFKFKKEKLGSISFLVYYIYRLKTMSMISISFKLLLLYLIDNKENTDCFIRYSFYNSTYDLVFWLISLLLPVQ